MPIVIADHSLEVRPIAQEDVEAVLEVYRQCEDFRALGPVSTASLEMVLKDIQMSKEQGGVFCGIYMPDGKMIAAPFRGHGIGAAVVAAFENEIRKDTRITSIDSGVQVNNPQAIKFWQRQGYRIVRGPIFHPDRTTAFDLRKDLH